MSTCTTCGGTGEVLDPMAAAAIAIAAAGPTALVRALADAQHWGRPTTTEESK